MKYAKLENDIVVQIQPNEEDGFIEVDDYVVCGMIKNGNIFEVPAKTPEELAEQEHNQKWQLVNDYLANDIPNFINPSTGHEFIVKGSHIQDIKGEYLDWVDSDSFDWEQYGIPIFKTNKAELGIVISYVKEEKQNKIVEVFGLGV